MLSSVNSPKISIITVVFNNADTIAHALDSVASQDYSDIEHVVVDGESTDGTSAIIQARESRLGRYIREPDKGMYDAMNKGINAATGEIVGILNADDFFVDKTIVSRIANQFSKNPTDCLYGDIQFVSKNDPSRVVRYYSSRHCSPERFAYGFMPAHPSFYVKRSVYQENGLYKTNYKIAADYELMTRYLWVKRISYQYLQEPLVRMRTGGASNAGWSTYWTLNREVVRACRENGMKTSLLKVMSKYAFKLLELFPGKH